MGLSLLAPNSEFHFSREGIWVWVGGLAWEGGGSIRQISRPPPPTPGR